MADKFPFLSDAWFDAAAKLISEHDAGAPPGTNVLMNLEVDDGDNKILFHMGSRDGATLFGKGHDDGADVTLSTDMETARAVFVDGNPQAGMQAFMSGKVRVQGDMTKLMMAQVAVAAATPHSPTRCRASPSNTLGSVRRREPSPRVLAPPSERTRHRRRRRTRPCATSTIRRPVRAVRLCVLGDVHGLDEQLFRIRPPRLREQVVLAPNSPEVPRRVRPPVARTRAGRRWRGARAARVPAHHVAVPRAVPRVRLLRMSPDPPRLPTPRHRAAFATEHKCSALRCSRILGSLRGETGPFGAELVDRPTVGNRRSLRRTPTTARVAPCRPAR